MKFCHPSAPCSANALQTKDTLFADGLARMARGRTSHRKSTGRRVSRFHSSVVPAHCETEDRFTFCLPLLYQNSMLGWVKLALPPALFAPERPKDSLEAATPLIHKSGS